MNVKILKGLVILILLVFSSFLVFKIVGFSVQSFSRSGIVIDEGIIVVYNEFDGPSTTDFLRMSDSELGSVSPLVLENIWGKIRYLAPINLTVKVNNRTVNLDENAEIAHNFIFLDTNFFPHMSKPAEISIYKLGFTNPQVLKNGAPCLFPNCNIISYNGTLVFNADSFSTYSAEETPSAAPAQGGGFLVRFSVDKELINVSLMQSESKRERIVIKNTGSKALLLTLNVNGLWEIAKLDKTVFSLNPGESKEVIIEFSADGKTEAGIYTGRIIINTVSLSKEVNVILEVLENPLPLKLFELKSELVSDKLMKGDKLRAKLDIKNLDKIPKDITLKYYIKDFSGRDIEVGEENMALIKEAKFERGFSIPDNLNLGKYVFSTELVYNGEISATSVNTFDLVEAVCKREISGYILAAALLILILVLILLKRRKKEKKRK